MDESSEVMWPNRGNFLMSFLSLKTAIATCAADLSTVVNGSSQQLRVSTGINTTNRPNGKPKLYILSFYI